MLKAQAVARPRVEIRAGLAAGLLAGAAVLALEPFGSVQGRSWESSEWTIGNGFLLGFTPLLAIFRAYRRVRATPFSPRGLEERRTIGGRWMLGTCAIHAFAPASALVWDDDGPALGIVLTVLVALSWLAFVETQRRTRRPLPREEWTGPEIDRLRVNSEVLSAAMVWTVAAAVYEALSPSTISMIGWIVGGAGVAVGLAFIRVVVSLDGRCIPAGLLAVAYIASSIGICTLARPVVGQILLLVGVPAMALILERARRQRQKAVAADLAGSGFSDAIKRRYGDEFAVPVMPRSRPAR